MAVLNGLYQQIARHIAQHNGNAEGQAVCFSHFSQQGKGVFKVWFGPCCACTANDQGHIQLPGRFQDHFKITPNHIARCCHLP